MWKFLFIITIILSSCSGSWHLKQAAKKGVIVKRDTIYKEVIVPGSTTIVRDTIYNFTRHVRVDTFKTETVKWKLKLKYDTITNEVFTQVECLPDTIRVPVEVNNNFEDVISKTPWYQWLMIGVMVILLLMLGIKMFK